MVGPEPRDRRAEYVARVNRVMDHIERNLDRSLKLDELADVAHFSRHHFHRIFGAMVGETLNQFVRRVRVERAASMLSTNPEVPVTTVALDCGFSSPATFARAFKENFGVSASEWRAEMHSERRKEDRQIRKAIRQPGNAQPNRDCYIDPQTSRPRWRYEMTANGKEIELNVEVQELPPRHVVYLRHTGPYGQPGVIPKLVGQLMGWAAARDLVNADTLTMMVPHDNPDVTEPEKLRTSVCLTAPENVQVEGEVGKMTVSGGKFAVAHFEIRPERIGDAWNALMGDWLPHSGFQPDDRHCYEVARNNPREHPEGKIVLDICVPVKPL